ncbi:aminotransferase class I/II-fold pyridoxal phosphate-dependent enzyme [Falsihalocynthiibacter arcticus]|uniref:Aspartate aminotransferase n=1 Tax=Falsihalocynthiibacter arcticus TaxID=1579316 RepID=A0A126UXL3_9RHOB|nr:aminotransferase class I/II-fold pyridoxal phosphate-dependent enzyme [Falsihalocynthiibacter arcticus]AML50790.1 aspartate aminotransferase [Falsihalocynthiibacter arcticus]
MVFPERFSNLPEYAFPRLRTLLDSHAPGGEPFAMTIGEPTHPFPPFVTDVIAENAAGFNRYPPNDGAPELLASIAGWIERRYNVALPSSQIMTVNGSREGLYNAAMALCPESKNGVPVVLIPNPFYQVYGIGAISVNAESVYVSAERETGYMPNYAGLEPETLRRTALAYICSPSNPQGAVASRAYWKELITLAEKFDFQILADECYSEIYRVDAPVGVLQVAAEMGADPERVVIFHSLSKRSNLPGLRSGFIAGGPETMARLSLLRAYSGAPLPLPLQMAAAKVWDDEAHVVANRKLYAEKFDIADEIFDGIENYESPEAGFFLWLPVEDGEAAALKLWRDTGVRVLPGAYLSRDINGHNPGQGYIRVALVAPKEEVRAGLKKIRNCIYSEG